MAYIVMFFNWPGKVVLSSLTEACYRQNVLCLPTQSRSLSSEIDDLNYLLENMIPSFGYHFDGILI